MLLVSNSIAHLLVDAVCDSVIFFYGKDQELAAAAMLYNTLAFAGQAPAGAFIDGLKSRAARSGFKLGACFAVAAAFLIPGMPLIIRIVLAGAGNCFFHVCAGVDTIEDSKGKAAPLGVFVAPGAIGLAFGVLYPLTGEYTALALIAIGIVTALSAGKGAQKMEAGLDISESKPTFLLPAVLLTAAVMVRAFGGSIVSFPWKSGNAAALFLAFAVFLGKSLGGFASDRFGAAKTALITIIPSALLTAFAQSLMVPSLAGQLLLNVSMPITLWLLYKKLPGRPGTAFGLAAAALWPGTLAGSYLAPAVTLAPYVTLAAFGFALFAVYCSSKRGERQ